LWASEQTCVVKLIGREAVIDKLVYAATNPVLAHLVDRVHHWPGVNGLAALLAGRSVCATRPLHFFRPDGPMAETLEMSLTIPAELGPAAEVRAELDERVRAVEHERAIDRQRSGRRVLGRRGVLAQSWRDPETARQILRGVVLNAKRPVGESNPCAACRRKATTRGGRRGWRRESQGGLRGRR
jgi:hypothetical protein